MNTTYSTPVAIVIGFSLIAIAIYLNGLPSVSLQMNMADAASAERSSETAFVYGDKDAPVTIVEFSDFECPFCARLHPTLERIVDESGGQIKWEFRHLPLPSHRNAEVAAIAAECVGRNVGEEAFWSYTADIFENYQNVTKEFLFAQAQTYSLTEQDLNDCEADSDIKAQIAADVVTAQAFGGNGTPFNVVVFADGRTQPVSGALPYANWMALLESN